MYRSKKKRNIIIFSLVGILICMVAGYAAFQTQLEIKGTSKVTSNCDIRITNVTDGTPTGTAENTVAPSWTNLTASMEADLYGKGDAMEYDVTIENKGTIDAKLDDITTNIQNANSDAVNITFSGYTKGEKLLKGESKIIHVKIEYNPNYTGGETSSEVEIDFNYTQNNNSSDAPETYLLTYDYQTNGGTKADSTGEYLISGAEVNLQNTATKEGYTFIGWNTDKDAQIGMQSYQMPSTNTTLYAIYSKDVKITYQKGNNIESIGKETDTCTLYNNDVSCEITLPTINANAGYTSVGWNTSNGATTGTAAENKLTISTNVTYYANAIDDIAPTKPILTNPSNESWTSDNVTITIKSTDEGSGIDHYEWYENNAGTTRAMTTSNGVGTITYTADRNESIKFRAIDKAGNISEVSTTSVKIDKTAPTCISSGESNKWVALTQTITGTCTDSGSGCTNTQISKTYSIAENITGNYDSSYSPGTVSDNAGNTTICPNVKVRVTGTTLKDYTQGALFMYDGKTGLSNTTWQDQSGNNRNGTLVGAVKSGNSVYFDGVDDYVRIAELNYQNITLETSFKAETLGNTETGVRYLMANLQLGGYSLQTYNNKLYMNVYKNGSYVAPGISSPIEVNRTYYAAGRADNSYQKITLGEASQTSNVEGEIGYPALNTYMVLGTNPRGTGLDTVNESFNGYMYTARMYSKVLTDDELQKHYVIDKWRFNY